MGQENSKQDSKICISNKNQKKLLKDFISSGSCLHIVFFLLALNVFILQAFIYISVTLSNLVAKRYFLQISIEQ